MQLRLAGIGIMGISPLRCEPLIGERYGTGYNDPRFGTPRAIASKNFMDVQRCDMTLCYFPEDLTEAYGVSLGTVVELAWAKALSKPTILISKHPKVIKHPVLDACAGWKLDDLDTAFEVISGVYTDYKNPGNHY